METKRTMTHASLFSGIGGAELAASWMGWENLFHCEINPFCRRVLEYWFPNSTSYEDITTTDFTPWRGKIDILTGGFPCQPFSLAGSRKGAEDDRYLWPHMLRAVREIQPAWVVGENVAGILTMVQPGEAVDVASQATLFGEDNDPVTRLRQTYTLEAICQDLEDAGYSVQPFLVPACAVGAPHRRDRVWIVARLAADTAGIGRAGRCAAGGRHDDNPPLGRDLLGTDAGRGGERIAPYAHLDRQRERTDEQEPLTERHGTPNHGQGGSDGHLACPAGRVERHAPAQPSQEDISPGIRDKWLAPHALQQQGERIGLEQQEPRRARQGQFGRSRGEDDSILPADRWATFPTQSPVCGRHDGFSALLDGITFPKWREESLKAYGNAIVPQVAYEIFHAIQAEYDNAM